MTKRHPFDILFDLSLFLYKLDAVDWVTIEPVMDLGGGTLVHAFCERMGKPYGPEQYYEL